MNSALDITYLIQEAKNRWLKPAEVLIILQNYENYQFAEAPPQKPTSGSLFFYNKRVTRFFRNDGHSWRRKSTGRSVREGHERLKVGNAEALNCYYAHGEQNPNFQRRCFWMLDPEYEHIVLVHYRDISEGKGNAESRHLSPDSSPAMSFYAAENGGSTSVISEPYESTFFSPKSSEFSSESLIRNNGVNHIGETGRVGEVGIPCADNVIQALGRSEEQLNLNGNTLPYCEENKRPNDLRVQNFERRSNLDELVALHYTTSDYGESHQFPDHNAGFSNYSNSSVFLPNPGGCTTESNDDPSMNVLPEQCPGSCWIDPRGKLSDPLDQFEKLLSVSERGDISANLDEIQDKWISQWLDPSGPGNNIEYMSDSHPTVPNSCDPQVSEARVGLLSSEYTVSASEISLRQKVEHSKVSAHTFGTRDHEVVSNFFRGQTNQSEVSLGVDSRLNHAQKRRFIIQEMSPEWGYATENTKVIIVGSFRCDPSECTWSCRFGEIEVPVHIIQEGVLSCQAPPHTPGKVSLCITSSNCGSCSEAREFDYRSKPSSCDNCGSLQIDARHAEEVLLLVRLVQMLLCDPLVLKEERVKSVANMLGLPKIDEDHWQHIIEELLIGTQTPRSTKAWLLEELLKDKLQHWFLSKCKKEDLSGCFLTKREQGIIHLVAGLGFEWALLPILRCGVSVNYRDINGWTALHWAARFGREKMVAALIATGASAGAVTDPTSQDPIGKSPGFIASASGHKGLAGYLSEVALTSHISSLTLEESDMSKKSSGVEVEKIVESISMGSANSTDDQFSIKDSLGAVRNSAQAAARIQSIFHEHSYRRKQQREAAGACCDEYGITPYELASASKLALHRFRDHMLDEAALSVQKKYRGWKGRQEFLALRQKVAMIQAHVRGYRVRKMYKVILWAVGVLEKIVLRWCRKRVGLRGFQPESGSVDESDYEDVLEAFRKLKVYQAVDEALSRVLSMVESPEARQQYRRMLESYWQAKADFFEDANEVSLGTQVIGVDQTTDSNLHQ